MARIENLQTGDIAIGGTFRSTAADLPRKLVETDQVYDDKLEKTQEEINQEVQARLNSMGEEPGGGSVDLTGVVKTIYTHNGNPITPNLLGGIITDSTGDVLVTKGANNNTIRLEVAPNGSIATKSYVDGKLEDIDNELFVVVETLPDSPSEGNENKLHLVQQREEEGTIGNLFEEYIWVSAESSELEEDHWEMLGTFQAAVETPAFEYVSLKKAAQLRGSGSVASGLNSVAEGNGTTASGNYSHAEGNKTKASGINSHAEGSQSVASGEFSCHAEGEGTTASGKTSHAEGAYTVAEGDFSHAEGTYTTASGKYSHAGGDKTLASGKLSFAYGRTTTASGYCSFSLGSCTQATNVGEFSCGSYSESKHHTNEYDEDYLTGSPNATLFTVGNGTRRYITNLEQNEYHYHNAFEIRQNGDIYIADTNNTSGKEFYKYEMVRLQDYIINGGNSGGENSDVISLTTREVETIFNESYLSE